MNVDELRDEIKKFSDKHKFYIDILEYDEDIFLMTQDYNPICRISKEYTFISNFDFPWFRTLDEALKQELAKIVYQYISTPLNKRMSKNSRTEETKYYLKHRYLYGVYRSYCYLNIYEDGDTTLNDNANSNGKKSRFTLEDIEQLKKRLGTDFSDFEIIEVKDEVQ